MTRKQLLCFRRCTPHPPAETLANVRNHFPDPESLSLERKNRHPINDESEARPFGRALKPSRTTGPPTGSPPLEAGGSISYCVSRTTYGTTLPYLALPAVVNRLKSVRGPGLP